jgi:2-oxoglutarate ferredoxin oxidoreductase subunit alpha
MTTTAPAVTAQATRRERVLMKRNEAIAEAAIQAGCDAYFGYPITPQAELLEWMAPRMPELGRAFVQAESELGAINMALGAAATGARVMVSTSSPGMSLMAEAMSYMAGSETPVVLVNVMRGGPGLGSIGPSQSDYFQATKGHGHGDYRVPVLAPATPDSRPYRSPSADLVDSHRGTPARLTAPGHIEREMHAVLRGADRRDPARGVRGLAGPRQLAGPHRL